MANSKADGPKNINYFSISLTNNAGKDSDLNLTCGYSCFRRFWKVNSHLHVHFDHGNSRDVRHMYNNCHCRKL